MQEDKISYPKYYVGEVVIYQNGNTFQLGVVKKVNEDSDSYFVNYHTGDTAALTHAQYLHKIENCYAFLIVRKHAEIV